MAIKEKRSTKMQQRNSGTWWIEPCISEDFSLSFKLDEILEVLLSICEFLGKPVCSHKINKQINKQTEITSLCLIIKKFVPNSKNNETYKQIYLSLAKRIYMYVLCWLEWKHKLAKDVEIIKMQQKLWAD